MIRSFLYSLTLMLLTGFLLSGCDKVATTLLSTGDKINDYLVGDEVNVRESSYAAADYLTQQINSYMRKHNTFYIAPLMQAGSQDLSSEFGRTVSAQLAERFRQLGYNVVNDPSAYAAYALGGTYDIGKEVDIRLEVMRKSDGRIIAAFDYKMPKNTAIRRSAEPEAQIFRSTY